MLLTSAKGEAFFNHIRLKIVTASERLATACSQTTFLQALAIALMDFASAFLGSFTPSVGYSSTAISLSLGYLYEKQANVLL
jgi:hypothetical protein